VSAPGSLRWLVGQQLRWQWRALSRRGRGGLLALLAFVGLGTAALYFTLRGVLGELPLGGPLPGTLLGPVLVAQAFLFTLMVSAAVRASLEALFTRGDLDLLLHSPLPARTVLAARALGVALSGAAGAALIVVPALLVLLALGAWRGLGLLGWWAAAALGSASAGLWLTLGLVRLLGVRRARVVASVVGALVGASLFLASQWRTVTGQDSAGLYTALARFRPDMDGWPGPEAALWWPARALWLDPGPLLAVLLLSGGVFAVTVLALTRQFTLGVQEGAGAPAPSPSQRGQRASSQGGGLRFAGGARATLLKEWRLLLRDPDLLSRTLLQLVYLVPLLAVVGREGGAGGAAGGGVVLLTANLASALARLTLDAEDAPDLLVTAPRSPAALRREKWLAAALPAATLGALTLGVLGARGLFGAHPLTAPVLMALTLLGTGGAALMVLWRPLPVRRADAFRQRESPPLINTLLGLGFQVALTGTAYAAARSLGWGALSLAAALALLAAAYRLRTGDGR
jgi:ABC-2 type transport system permease protein